MGRKIYVVDIAGDENRVDYVAVSNTCIGALILILGAAIGGLSAITTPHIIIALMAMIAAIGGILAYRLAPA